jgi:hypothetical protein
MRRPRERLASAIPSLPADPLFRAGWGATAGAVVAVGAVTGLVFALRMGAVLGLLTLVLLRAGFNVRRLLIVATVAIALIPAIYLVFPATDKGGFSFQYASDQIFAHWVAVVAVFCLAWAGGLAALRVRRGQRAAVAP